MNIAETEGPFLIVAKTCGCGDKSKVTYEFIDSCQSLWLDKKDIIYAELEACERLQYMLDERDQKTVESEIRELKIGLDLLA
jgi:hypothetical protein